MVYHCHRCLCCPTDLLARVDELSASLMPHTINMSTNFGLEGTTTTPFLYTVLLGAATLIVCLFMGAQFALSALHKRMKRTQHTTERSDDVEMQGEVAVRLFGKLESETDEISFAQSPPAYDQLHRDFTRLEIAV